MTSDREGSQGASTAESQANALSRREFLQGTGAALVAAGGVVPALATSGCVDVEGAGSAIEAVPRTPIRLVVNGAERRLEVEDRWTLNEVLRDQLELTGSKLGCDRGECGACTVLMDGTPVYSCSHLAVWADGRNVLTVEGLADENGEASPLQAAFMDHNAPQCGFCTPGQLMSATALLLANPRPTADDVRSALVGNLCRCSNFNAIVESVLMAAGTLPPGAELTPIVGELPPPEVVRAGSAAVAASAGLIGKLRIPPEGARIELTPPPGEARIESAFAAAIDLPLADVESSAASAVSLPSSGGVR